MRWPAAVNAMSLAVLMDVTFAPSIRVNNRRCVCASTTAILIGTFSSRACLSAACRAILAPFCVRVGVVVVVVVIGAIFTASVV